MSLASNWKDSELYQAIDVKCAFCHEKITREDCQPPRQVVKGQKSGNYAHGECVSYVLAKYPKVPCYMLEGKIQRPRQIGGHYVI